MPGDKNYNSGAIRGRHRRSVNSVNRIVSSNKVIMGAEGPLLTSTPYMPPDSSDKHSRMLPPVVPYHHNRQNTFE
jgi:hypothetical protein